MNHKRMTYLKKNKVLCHKISSSDDMFVEMQRANTRSPYVLIVSDFNANLRSNYKIKCITKWKIVRTGDK